MNCASCGRLIYVKQQHCECGWKIPHDGRPSGSRRIPDLGGSVGQRFGEQQSRTTKYIREYRQSHEGTRNSDACLAYFRERGLLRSSARFALPDSLRPNDEADVDTDDASVRG